MVNVFCVAGIITGRWNQVTIPKVYDISRNMRLPAWPSAKSLWISLSLSLSFSLSLSLSISLYLSLSLSISISLSIYARKDIIQPWVSSGEIVFVFQWRNKTTNLMFVFLMSLLHMIFGKTDAQEMQKCWGFRKFSSVLNPCYCRFFSFIIQKSSRF